MTALITLQYCQQLLQVAPSLGAAITRYAVVYEGKLIDFLRPASKQAIERREISEMSSFLMVPWAGRIYHGSFTYDGKQIVYPSRLLDNPHSMHGFTRDFPWVVESQQENSLILKFGHHADKDWPFSFEVIQQYGLDDTGLSIWVDVKNTGDKTMPFSMGHHPFFPCDANTKLYTRVQQAWFNDNDMMPTHLDNHPLVEKLEQGYAVQEQVWDTIFTGWDRKVVIDWGDRQLSYQVSEPMNFFVLYNPQGMSWFCAEPFANITDSFNLRNKFPRESIGGMDLLPGEGIKTSFLLQPRFKSVCSSPF
ncbi:aldose 1-epimerase [Pelistega europaea]|uniref:Aldose 1-epimerase n=1 Tax=Pelistega europaea TaxID=106147 RepID=A0A7Y4LAS6_9BURK|nr:aldose 1-epimerase [Pelistega europaea]NOL50094.1 aldose 1-epimerase [Pelistega europaea]